MMQHDQELAIALGAKLPIQSQSNYAGVRRLPYFGLMGGSTFAFWWLMSISSASPEEATLVWALPLLYAAVSVFLVAERLKNIGMSAWWCLLCLVPVVGILVGYRCLAFQEGYVYTKRLDTSGRLITCVTIGLLLGVVGLFLLPVLS